VFLNKTNQQNWISYLYECYVGGSLTCLNNHKTHFINYYNLYVREVNRLKDNEHIPVKGSPALIAKELRNFLTQKHKTFFDLKKVVLDLIDKVNSTCVEITNL